MKCTIYRSARKDFTYLYLADSLSYDELPEELRSHFGEPSVVMRLDLEKTTKLAHADVSKVRAALDQLGYFLQFPPDVPVEEEIARRLR